MKTKWTVAALFALALGAATAQQAIGQVTGRDFKIPRTKDGKPNFSGVWAGPAFLHPDPPGDFNAPAPQLDHLDGSRLPPLTELGKKEFLRKHTGIEALDNPFSACINEELIGVIMSPYSQEWVMAPNFILIRNEYVNNPHRVIWMDGRAHSNDVEPTHFGESIGHWEGDTLVIDTTGIQAGVLDEHGHISSDDRPGGGVRFNTDQLHVIERISWTGPRRVKYEITTIDPPYYTQPWTSDLKMTLQPTWQLLQMVCEENNRCQNGTCKPPEQ